MDKTLAKLLECLDELDYIIVDWHRRDYRIDIGILPSSQRKPPAKEECGQESKP